MWLSQLELSRVSGHVRVHRPGFLRLGTAGPLFTAGHPARLDRGYLARLIGLFAHLFLTGEIVPAALFQVLHRIIHVADKLSNWARVALRAAQGQDNSYSLHVCV